MNKYTVIDNGSDYDYDYRVTVVDGKQRMRELNQMLFSDISCAGPGIREKWMTDASDSRNTLTRCYYSSGRDVYQITIDENGNAVELLYIVKGDKGRLLSQIKFIEKEYYEHKSHLTNSKEVV